MEKIRKWKSGNTVTVDTVKQFFEDYKSKKALRYQISEPIPSENVDLVKVRENLQMIFIDNRDRGSENNKERRINVHQLWRIIQINIQEQIFIIYIHLNIYE